MKKDLVAEGGAHKCIHGVHEEMAPGNADAPGEINQSFAKLHDQGYEFVRTARKVFWEKDNIAGLRAYDPQIKDVVEVLRIKGK